MLDLPSGYVFVEEITENCQYETWQQQANRTKNPNLRQDYTAAERLFGRQFPDLFEYLIENIGELPQPRKPRQKSSKSQTFTLPTVPS